jgi:SAM-dependent methyltransferase
MPTPSDPTSTRSEWLAFWDSPHSLYVNARHKNVCSRLTAESIAALVPSPQARVLDYGCGEALHADLVAAAAGELLLCEAAPRARDGLAARFAESRNSKIRVVAPDELERLPAHSLDFIVLNSVTQYLTPEEAGKLLALFHKLLQSGGVLLVGDVIPPHVAALTEVIGLLRLAAANGFLFAALLGLIRNLISDYWRLRKRLGLTRYSEAAMIETLAAAGFTACRTPKNIGHHWARMAFIARPAHSR